MLRSIVWLALGLVLCSAWEVADVTNRNVIAAAQTSVRLYEGDTHVPYALRLNKLFRAQIQLEMNGTRYRFQESIGSTNCTRQKEDSDPSKCVIVSANFCFLETFDSGNVTKLVIGGCERAVSRKTRTDDGGWQDVNVNNPQVQISALRALSMYETQSQSSNALRMTQLISARMQVVAGVRYNFLENVGVTNCSRQQEDANPNNCAIQSHQICNFTTFEQVWTDTYVLEASACHPNVHSAHAASDKRIIPTLPPIDGGWQPLNISDPKVQESALRAVRLYEDDSKSPVALRMLQLLRAEAQIVSGVQYKFLEVVGITNCTREQEDANSQNCAVKNKEVCSFETLEQVWTDTYILEASECFPHAPTSAPTLFNPPTSGSKQQNYKHLPHANPPEGGWQQLNTSSPQVQESAQRAVRLYETDSQSPVALRMLNLFFAEMQIVAGVRYHFVEEIGATNCTRAEEDSNANNCAIQSKQICNFTTFEQAWTDTYILEDSQCKPPEAKMARQAAKNVLETVKIALTLPPHEEGGWHDVNVNNTQVQTSAIRAVQLYEDDTNSQYALRMITLLHAEAQVVAGMNYKFFETIGVTNCSRMQEDNDSSLCFITLKQVCNFTTFEQSWTNTYTLVSSFCVIPPFGSWQMADVNSVEIKEAATEASRLYQVVASPMLAVRVVKILESKKQVTNGINYNLKLILGTTRCSPTVEKSSLTSCSISKTQICEMTLNMQVLTRTSKLSSARCASEMTDYILIPPNGVQATEAANAGIAQIDVKSSGLLITLNTVNEAKAKYSEPPSGITMYDLDVDVDYNNSRKMEVSKLKLKVEKLMLFLIEGVPQKTYLLISCETSDQQLSDSIVCTYVAP